MPIISDSVTKQAAFLMAGRMFSMPITFLVPMVLVRYFSVTEFGHYRQLFLIFFVVLPIMDMGISNSLFYFLPKYPEKKEQFLSQTYFIQFFLCITLVVIFYVFGNEISNFICKSNSLTPYILYIGMFAAMWHFSKILEVVLIIEKKAHIASIISFSSDLVRSLLSIIVVVLFHGNLKDLLLYGLLITGILRIFFMIVYVVKRKTRIFMPVRKEFLYSQVRYALPIGLAVAVMSFVLQSHQYVVSIMGDTTKFAIYTVGCFQLPFLGIILDSIAKTSLIRMMELSKLKNGKIEITRIILNSIRKLWIIFFPMFFFLFVYAHEVVVFLFTDKFTASIPVFKVFIFIIPVSAIMLRHVPRVFAETKFILQNNFLLFVLSVCFCIVCFTYFGVIGSAMGFVFANIISQLSYFIKCKEMLDAGVNDLIPFRSILYVSVLTSGIGIISCIFKMIFRDNLIILLVTSALFFYSALFVVFWKCNVLLDDEKYFAFKVLNKIVNSIKKIVFFSFKEKTTIN